MLIARNKCIHFVYKKYALKTDLYPKDWLVNPGKFTLIKVIMRKRNSEYISYGSINIIGCLVLLHLITTIIYGNNYCQQSVHFTIQFIHKPTIDSQE